MPDLLRNPDVVQRLGVLGGTFDPIHHGHLAAAREVADHLSLDQVLLVPAAQPWQKTDRDITSARHRMRMVQLAVEGEARLGASDIDIQRAGPTYTVDTLAELARQHPTAEVFFILGADALAGLPTWRDPEQVVRAARIVAVTRPGHTVQVPEMATDAVIVVEIPDIDISSTECRRRVAQGLSLDSLVPDAVAEYIQTHGLYRS
jgi:nicotinate-nucleotide adenylyltransferase